jgi:hypothetical protein
MELQIASREKVKIRMSISAPTGFGKTFSALLIAHGMTDDWSKIAVIDTENRSASLYAHLGTYYTIPIEPPFTTEKYIQAIELCEKSGIEVIIIDSVTHVWKGQGGLLEYQNSLGGKYQDWAKTTPLYQKWLNKILHSSCHVITTMRKKQAYAVVQEGGKTKVEKKGLEDEIRDGYDYEMTVAFEIITDTHLAKTSKDRTRLFDGKPEFVPDQETGRQIKQWCELGIYGEAAQKAFKEAKEKAFREVLESSIKQIKKAKTVENLSEIKAYQPKEVIVHPEFKAAAMEVYNKLNQPVNN